MWYTHKYTVWTVVINPILKGHGTSGFSVLPGRLSFTWSLLFNNWLGQKTRSGLRLRRTGLTTAAIFGQASDWKNIFCVPHFYIYLDLHWGEKSHFKPLLLPHRMISKTSVSETTFNKKGVKGCGSKDFWDARVCVPFRRPSTPAWKTAAALLN